MDLRAINNPLVDLRPRWEKLSEDFFFGVGGGTQSNSDGLKDVRRFQRKRKEERHQG